MQPGNHTSESLRPRNSTPEMTQQQRDVLHSPRPWGLHSGRLRTLDEDTSISTASEAKPPHR